MGKVGISLIEGDTYPGMAGEFVIYCREKRDQSHRITTPKQNSVTHFDKKGCAENSLRSLFTYLDRSHDRAG